MPAPVAGPGFLKMLFPACRGRAGIEIAGRGRAGPGKQVNPGRRAGIFQNANPGLPGPGRAQKNGRDPGKPGLWPGPVDP